MKTTVKQAQATTIYFVNDNMEVGSDSLYNFVMESAEQTTSPRGVMNKLFLDEKEVSVYKNEAGEEIDESAYNELTEDEQSEYSYIAESVKYQVRHWMGSKSQLVEEFETEDEAQDLIFDRTYNFDFIPDDQRITSYYSTKEDAEKELAELLHERQ